MTESLNDEWQYGEHSGLVSIGTHSLFLQASGPPRNPGDSVVIFESGLGGNGLSWASVARLVSRFARIYIYSRSGLGKSQRQPTPSPRTATAMAAELSSLLNAAAIDPPFILVSHSYGGVIAREFLAQRTADIVGMVFVDTNTERTEIERPSDMPLFLKILGTLDINTILEMDKRHSFTPEEWMAIEKSDDENGAAVTEAEYQEMASSGLILGSKNQLNSTILGNYPVSVIRGDSARDIRKILNAGVAAGNGTKEQHEKMKFFVDELADIDERHQREQLKLSKCGRVVYARKSGHNVQMTEPEVVAEEIRWIWDTLNERRLRGEM